MCQKRCAWHRTCRLPPPAAIAACSTVGGRQRLWIELHSADPLSPVSALADSTAPPQRAAVPEPARLSTLLYIEDNAANLRLVEEIVLLMPGLRLLAAPDAQLGLQLARAHLPDRILMDLIYPA